MVHFSVTRFAPLSKRLIISIPLFLGVLLLGANRVEAVVENCGSTYPAGFGHCSCNTTLSGDIFTVLDCNDISAGFSGTM